MAGRRGNLLGWRGCCDECRDRRRRAELRPGAGSAAAPLPRRRGRPAHLARSYHESMSSLHDRVSRRRTFAIISHPDAGKTTLTEKLLLFGGAIQLAGEVKARGERRRARSDWMAIERE